MGYRRDLQTAERDQSGGIAKVLFLKDKNADIGEYVETALPVFLRENVAPEGCESGLLLEKESLGFAVDQTLILLLLLLKSDVFEVECNGFTFNSHG